MDKNSTKPNWKLQVDQPCLPDWQPHLRKPSRYLQVGWHQIPLANQIMAMQKSPVYFDDSWWRLLFVGDFPLPWLVAERYHFSPPYAFWLLWRHCLPLLWDCRQSCSKPSRVSKGCVRKCRITVTQSNRWVCLKIVYLYNPHIVISTGNVMIKHSFFGGSVFPDRRRLPLCFNKIDGILLDRPHF